MQLVSFIRSAVPFVAMITVQCLGVGMSVVSKAAMTKGMSNLVFVVYYNALSTIILLPFVVFTRSRRNGAPFITFSILCRFFLLGLIGSLGQLLSFTGIKYSSPTLASAMASLVPLFTFVLAILFRMEKLDLRSPAGLAVSLGAVVSVSGAFIVTFYKGPQFQMMTSSFSIFPYHDILCSKHSNWVFGGLILAISYLLIATWNIFMVVTMKLFPEKMTIVFFLCFFATLLSGIFSLIMERNPNAWTLRPDTEMVAILYSAIFGRVLHYAVHTWCLQEKGPIFVTMFKPLGIAIAMVMGILFLGESLYIGSVVGSIIVAVGFYTVMWGKAKEQSLIIKDGVDGSQSQKTPLLQNNPTEEI